MNPAPRNNATSYAPRILHLIPQSCWKRSIGLVLVGLLSLVALASKGDPVTRNEHAPFVATYDRFGRHGEIGPREAGILLLTELNCTACHPSTSEAYKPKLGPKLNGVGNRIRFDWLKEFLRAPNVTKPGTTMPGVLACVPDEERQDTANALAAFLSVQREPFPEPKANGLNPILPEFWNRGNAAAGRSLFHQVGCVACHDPDPQYEVTRQKPSQVDELIDQLDLEELAELGLASAARKVNSVPLPVLPQKYSREALTHFLLNPVTMRPAGRMPGFNLTVMQSADLVAYLIPEPIPPISIQWPEDPSLQGAMIAKGRERFLSLRCVSCHELSGIDQQNPARRLEELNPAATRGCLTTPEAGQPKYALDHEQRTALAEAISHLVSDPLTAPAQTKLTMLQLNCYACHERDKRGGVGRYRKEYFETLGQVDIGDEGRLPPPLDGVGRKLTTSWMRNVFDGKGSVRPHMTIRMPRFTDQVRDSLPYLVAKVDGAATPIAEDVIFPSKNPSELLMGGRQLMDIGCVQCHSFRGETLPGTVGIDLAGATKRLQSQWFRDFLLDPGALKPRTRMPQFFPNGKSQHPDILQGDANLQIEAMWVYLKALEKQPLPAKIEMARAQNYELVPKGRPIILRTFMPDAGTHAIAVGFPEKVHFAFDAEKVQLVEAWRGRFLDAEGTWFVRFAPPAKPLGEELILFPQGNAFALLESGNGIWPKDSNRFLNFSGYRLDAAGVPTFLYRIGQFSIEDRVAPAPNQTLIRTITVTRQGAQVDATKLWFRINAGTSLQQHQPRQRVNDKGLSVTLGAITNSAANSTASSDGKLRNSGDTSEWILPLAVGPAEDDSITFELEYRW